MSTPLPNPIYMDTTDASGSSDLNVYDPFKNSTQIQNPNYEAGPSSQNYMQTFFNQNQSFPDVYMEPDLDPHGK